MEDAKDCGSFHYLLTSECVSEGGKRWELGGGGGISMN